MLALPETILTTERRPLLGLVGIVDLWRDLAEGALEPNVFYAPDFALPAADLFGQGVEVIVIRSPVPPRRPLGIFPFRVVRRRYGVKLPLILGWTHPFGPLGTPLVDRDAAPEVMRAFLDHVAVDPGLPKRMLLPLVNEDGPVAAALRAALAARGGTSVGFGRHQRAVLRPTGDRHDYVEHAIGRKRRKELRRQRHRLADAGPVSFDMVTARHEVGAALGDFFKLEAAGWKGRAGSAVAQHPDALAFVSSAVTGLASHGRASVARLHCGSRAVAAVVTLRSGQAAWSWKVAYDEAFSGSSPGVQAFLDLTDVFLADADLQFVDSCATADHPMIDHLWRERLAMVDLMVDLRPGAMFGLSCRLETGRRRAAVLARRLRDLRGK